MFDNTVPVIECCHKVHRPKRVVSGEQGIEAYTILIQ